MILGTQIPLSQLVMALSKAIDLISQDVANHQLQVSYISLALGTETALPSRDKNDLVIAGALHDVGALSLKNRLSMLDFEIEIPYEHEETGYLLLKDFEPFSSAASLIRHHHACWGNAGSQNIAIGSHILHLADRISVLIDKNQEILGQADRIFSTVSRHSGKMFMPELVDAFERISKREYFWLEAASPFLETILTQRVSFPAVSLNIDELVDLAKLFSKVIDFRCSFTATHSSGVAAVCEKLTELSGFSAFECKMMRVAGYLHDLGKIAVPEEILNKPGKLTEQEYYIVRKHTYFTYQILSSVSGLEHIATWASSHHEQLDGEGYPFHLEGEDLPIFSRILAVADIFTALTEDRPYRGGMASGRVLEILRDKANRLKLDPKIVSIVESNFDEINLARKAAQADSAKEYKVLVKA